MFELELLRKEGIPIGWRSLYVGWNRGFVTSDQLPPFAMDHIGYSNPSDEALVAELAFTDDRDRWTLQRCMETLSDRDHCSNQDVLRVWRWAVMKTEVDRIDSRPRIPDWYEEVAETEWDLEQTWQEFPGLPGSDNDHACLSGWVNRHGEEGIAEIVLQCRTWLKTERSAIQKYVKTSY